LHGPHRFGQKIKLPATIAIKHQIINLMFEDAIGSANLATPDTMPGVFRLRANSGPPQNGGSPLIVTRQPERTWG
jgi:hypothetical protein